MASDLPKATCLVGKPARTGPWHLDSRVFLDHYVLKPFVTRVGQVRVLGGLVLEDCVPSGPSMRPERIHKSRVVCMPPSVDPRPLPPHSLPPTSPAGL